jgi:hypothetical protein
MPDILASDGEIGERQVILNRNLNSGNQRCDRVTDKAVNCLMEWTRDRLLNCAIHLTHTKCYYLMFIYAEYKHFEKFKKYYWIKFNWKPSFVLVKIIFLNKLLSITQIWIFS